MAFPGTALISAWNVLRYRDTNWYAGMAQVAIRAVGEDAAAAKAAPHQIAVELITDQVGWRCYLRTRHASVQIAARVRCCDIELQYRLRQVVQLRHGPEVPG